MVVPLAPAGGRAPEHREPRLASPGHPGDGGRREPQRGDVGRRRRWGRHAAPVRQWPPGVPSSFEGRRRGRGGHEVWSGNDMSTVGLGEISTWRQDAMWSKRLVDSPCEQGEPTANGRHKAICSHMDKSMNGPHLVDLPRIDPGKQGPLLPRRRSGGANRRAAEPGGRRAPAGDGRGVRPGSPLERAGGVGDGISRRSRQLGDPTFSHAARPREAPCRQP